MVRYKLLLFRARKITTTSPHSLKCDVYIARSFILEKDATQFNLMTYSCIGEKDRMHLNPMRYSCINSRERGNTLKPAKNWAVFMKIKEKPIQIGSGLPVQFFWVFKTGTVPHPPPHAWLYI
jgi:hypothetical protein